MSRSEPEPAGMDRALLAAFADGALEPEDAARVVLHLADHPDDQAYVDEVMAANAALQRAFGGPMHQPVPAAIRDTILPPPPATVIPFRRRLVRMAGSGWLAAGLAAAAAVGAVAVLAPQGTPPSALLAVGPVAPGGALGALLADAPSGERRELGGGRSLNVLASLPVPDGYCREVELIDRPGATLSRALACTGAEGWQVAVVVAEGLGTVGPDGIAPASGGGADLTPWLDRLGAGLVLDPSEEARALAAGWR